MARLQVFLLTLLCGLGSWRAAAAEAADTDEDRAPSNETEFSVVPFVGGSSDVGFGGGYIASLAQLRPNHDPYFYRIDTTASVTFKTFMLRFDLAWSPDGGGPSGYLLAGHMF